MTGLSLIRARPGRPASPEDHSARAPASRRSPGEDAPLLSVEVIVAIAVVIACMCGALAVGTAYTLFV